MTERRAEKYREAERKGIRKALVPVASQVELLLFETEEKVFRFCI